MSQSIYLLVANHAQDAIKSCKLSDLASRSIAIDASCCVSSFHRSFKAQNGTTLASPGGQPIAHLVGLYLAVIRLVTHKIRPVFVFDVHHVSGATVKARQRSAMKAEHEEMSMQLLEALGMPIIRADGDAASLCAHLAHEGITQDAAVDDLTVLCFGGKLLCNLMDPPARGLPIQEIDPSLACSGLGITFHQLAHLCSILNSHHFHKVGPTRALAMIKEQQQQQQQVNEVQPYHQIDTPPPIPILCHSLHWRAPIVDNVLNIMMHEAQFKEDRVRRDCRAIAEAVNDA